MINGHILFFNYSLLSMSPMSAEENYSSVGFQFVPFPFGSNEWVAIVQGHSF